MKTFFSLCLLGALCLAASSCNDDKQENGVFSGTMTVNGQRETIKSAFYEQTPGDDTAEAVVRIAFLKEAYSEFPQMLPETRPDMLVLIGLSESLLGKTLDLTLPLDQNEAPIPALMYGATHEGHVTTGANYLSNRIFVSPGKTVASGVLTATRSGDRFNVRFSVTFSDGTSYAVDGEGRAKQSELPLS